MNTNQLFRTEVETMSRYIHENLLTLLAYSAEGIDCCLIYPYMPNGSLEHRLACDVIATIKLNYLTLLSSSFFFSCITFYLQILKC